MAMAAGTVTIADDGVATKSGFAEAIYDGYILMVADVDGEVPAGADGVPMKRGFAAQANRLASALVTYMTANAQAKIATTDAGIQRDADGANPDCLGPTVDKFVAIV